MSKARDLASAAPAPSTVSATELGYLDGVTSAVQTQIDGKSATSHNHNGTYEPSLPSQTGNSGKYLTTDGTSKSWGTVNQYQLPSQTGNAGKFLTTNGTTESWASVTPDYSANPFFQTLSVDTSSSGENVIATLPDSSGNVYVIGNISNFNGAGFIIKKDSSGNDIWQKLLVSTNSSYAMQFRFARLDSSGNIYINGTAWSGSGSTFRRNTVWKFNSSGSLLWTTFAELNTPANSSAMNVDSDGNVYSTGYYYQGGYYAWVTKFNSDGTIGWGGYQYASSSAHDIQFNAIAFDTSNNPILIGYEQTNSNAHNILVVKLNKSNSSLIFSYAYNESGTSEEYSYSGVADSNDNIYIGYQNASYRFCIMKINSAGAVQWSRNFASGYPSFMTIGEDGFLYASGITYNYYGSDQVQPSLLVKYDLSGAVQWQRTLYASIVSPSGFGFVDASKATYMYVGGSVNINGGGDGLFAKLKKDGTGTGTYSIGSASLVYKPTTYTDTSISVTKVNAATYWGANQTPNSGSVSAFTIYDGIVSSKTAYIPS